MKLRNRWLPLCLLWFGACIWLMWAFPRYHAGARLQLELDHDGYLALARQFAARHGLDVSGAVGSVSAETLAKNQELRFLMPADEMARTFPVAQIHANFTLPGKGGVAGFTFRPDGQPLAWKFPMPAQVQTSPAQASAPDAVMHEVAGADCAHYSLTSGGSDGTQCHWQRTETGSVSPHISIDASFRNGLVWQADTVFRIPEAISKQFDAFTVTRVVTGSIWVLLLLFALVVSVLREGGGRTALAMKNSSALWLSGAAVLSFVLSSWLGWEAQTISISSTASALGTKILAIVVGAMVLGLCFYAMFAGTVLNARLHPVQVRSLRLLGTSAVFSRTVGSALLAGWLLAPLLVALPLALSAAISIPAFKGYDDSLILARTPVLDTLLNSPGQDTIALLGLFGVMVPLALRFFIRNRMALAAISLLAFLTFAMLNAPFRHAQAANLALAALQTALSLWIYFRFGMLSAVAGYCWAGILTSAGVLLVQPAVALQGAGLGVLAAFASLGLVGLVLASKGNDLVGDLQGESGPGPEARSRREELLAEFNVARSAQQQMLPASAPVLPGYTLAAHCEPAREVGGDLYDFLRLSEGRWGIGVADVSGKGVPAALYMTLTKGLLCAAGQDSDDPRQILGSVNKHLRTVTKKKMFVTMALGVLDPVAGTVEYARAGHNPTVLRRVGTGETRLLGGPGIGLGMAGPVLFAKTLKAETVALTAGDALVFYSDGLTEAMNEELEQFGEERLMAAVERTDGMSAEATQDSILKEVSRFLKGGHSQDDLTIAVLRVNSDNIFDGR